MPYVCNGIEAYPGDQNYRLDDDEGPASHDFREAIGGSLAGGEGLIVSAIDIHDGRMVMLMVHARPVPFFCGALVAHSGLLMLVDPSLSLRGCEIASPARL